MKVIDFIVCDDVRQEVGNKKTLVGVYDAMQFNNIPPEKMNDLAGPYRMSFYFRIDFEGESFPIKNYGAEFLIDGKVFREVKVVGGARVSGIGGGVISMAFYLTDFMAPNADGMGFNVVLEGENSEKKTLPTPFFLKFSRALGHPQSHHHRDRGESNRRFGGVCSPRVLHQRAGGSNRHRLVPVKFEPRTRHKKSRESPSDF